MRSAWPARGGNCIIVPFVFDSMRRTDSESVAALLRSRGIGAEVFHRKAQWGKQMRRAHQLGIRYAWFPGTDGKPHEVKDLESGEQTEADPQSWVPDGRPDSLPIELLGQARFWP